MSELARALQDAQRRQMTHYDSYWQTQNPNDAFKGGPEAWAHGIYNASPNLMRDAEAVSQYSLPGMLAAYFNPGGGQELASTMIEKGLGTDLLNEEFTPSTPFQHGISFAGEATFDPLQALGLPFLGIQAAKNTPRFISQALSDLNKPPWESMKGIIGSTGAKTANLELLAKAQDMKAAGHSADDIYANTHWWLDHPDGRPRFEIDDSGSYFEGFTESPSRVGDALPHKDLYNAYPTTPAKYPVWEKKGLGDISIYDESNPYSSFTDGGSKGQYDESADRIGLGNVYSRDEAQSTTLHELQHAIQGRENMARGGGPAGQAQLKDEALARLNFLNTEQGKIARELDNVTTGYRQPKQGMEKRFQQLSAEYDAIMAEKMQMSPKLVQGDPYESYRALAGEAEARLVQDRMNMSMDERLANPFYKNFDVPLDEQIVRMEGGTAEMRGYHGSPHKFDKFDHSQMGTGEGAQAYGWGTYIAEDPVVAGTYQQFPLATKVYVDGKELGQGHQLSIYDGNIDDAISSTKREIEEISKSRPNSRMLEAYKQEFNELLDWKKRDAVSIYKPEGNLYEVDLPDSKIAQMLDWDAPLSGSRAEELYNSPDLRDSFEQLADMMDLADDPTALRGQEFETMVRHGLERDYLPINGPGVMGALEQGNKEKAASLWMKNEGIPGIKYFDGNSRRAGEGTRNFVVFDENDMTVLKRNDEDILPKH